MGLFGLIDFNMPAHSKEEIRILHRNHNISIEKLAEDLLYDREWCREQGIRYYDLKSPYENMSASEIARTFVINSLLNKN